MMFVLAFSITTNHSDSGKVGEGGTGLCISEIKTCNSSINISVNK